MSVVRRALIQSVERDGVTVDSVCNVIMVDDSETTWDGCTLIAADGVGDIGDDWEDSAFKALPRIDSIDVTSGPAAGGTTVIITGRRLDFGSLTVLFDGVEATNVRDRSYASATADAPAGSAGAVDVTVKNSEGETALSGGYTYT